MKEFVALNEKLLLRTERIAPPSAGLLLSGMAWLYWSFAPPEKATSERLTYSAPPARDMCR
jgi:hypothetical protein